MDLHVSHPRHAFTLVELLLVVAIIAVLISILLPALSSARRAGRAVACLANIRSLEQATLLYANENHEYLIDADLPHGGVGDPTKCWPVVLADYSGGTLIVRSPVDNSPAWPTAEGGSSPRMSLATYLALAADNPTNPPDPGAVARWTSYGLNSYTTTTVKPPRELMLRPRYNTLSLIPLPVATVHFLMMTEGFDGSSFAYSDHVHPETWSNGPPGSAPTVAAEQMQIDAHGGPPKSARSLSNYGFLDGHAATLPFSAVYTDFTHNHFDPDRAAL